MTDSEMIEELKRIIELRSADARVDATMSFFDTLLISGHYERFLELGAEARMLVLAIARIMDNELFFRRVQETGRLLFSPQENAAGGSWAKLGMVL